MRIQILKALTRFLLETFVLVPKTTKEIPTVIHFSYMRYKLCHNFITAKENLNLQILSV